MSIDGSGIPARLQRRSATSFLEGNDIDPAQKYKGIISKVNDSYDMIKIMPDVSNAYLPLALAQVDDNEDKEPTQLVSGSHQQSFSGAIYNYGVEGSGDTPVKPVSFLEYLAQTVAGVAARTTGAIVTEFATSNKKVEPDLELGSNDNSRNTIDYQNEMYSKRAQYKEMAEASGNTCVINGITFGNGNSVTLQQVDPPASTHDQQQSQLNYAMEEVDSDDSSDYQPPPPKSESQRASSVADSLHSGFFRRLSNAANSMVPGFVFAAPAFISSVSQNNSENKNFDGETNKAVKEPASVFHYNRKQGSAFVALQSPMISLLVDISEQVNGVNIENEGEKIDRFSQLQQQSLQNEKIRRGSLTIDTSRINKSTVTGATNVPKFNIEDHSNDNDKNPRRADSASMIAIHGVSAAMPKKTLFLGGHIAVLDPASVSHRSVTRNSVFSPRTDAEASGVSARRDGLSPATEKTPQRISAVRRRSVSTGIVIPATPSTMQVAVAAGGNIHAAVSPSVETTLEQRSTAVKLNPEGKSEVALKYLEAFAMIRNNNTTGISATTNVTKTDTSSDDKQKNYLHPRNTNNTNKLTIPHMPATTAATSTPDNLNSFGKVVRMAADMKATDMDPTLAAELDKDTLTMVLKLKKWARANKKKKSSSGGADAETTARRFNAQIETELPVHLQDGVVRDVLGVVEMYVTMYAQDLGPGHAFSVGAAKHLEKLRQRVREGGGF
ncbi:hypothetical protein HK100_005927 [Physocladia obscura]|uniref:Uncharacterized protein n=1 Tax=Physocladia obscura TaxID=109957 RepID=A0AAD5SR34_9FUNG|nr:hypothetical protein HK100_005927 [Physocladia obscura]